MIKTKIEFDCTWPKADVQKLFDKLLNADGVTELGVSMIFVPDEPTPTEEPEPAEVHTPEPKHIETEPLKPIDVPWPAKEEPKEQKQIEPETPDPDIFTEIDRIPGAELGHEMSTTNPVITYAETNDGRIVIFYSSLRVNTTYEDVRALPDKIPLDMVKHINQGKRAALRGFKKWLIEQDALENESPTDTKQKVQPDQEVDPYAQILTGGAKVDTRASGKIEGDLG